MTEVVERFLRYVAIDTQSEDDREEFPSTDKQKDLAKLLRDELTELGATVDYDEKYGYVYAKIPASAGCEDKPTLGLIAHMDTSSEASGANVKARIIENFDGNDIVLNEDLGIVMSMAKFPHIAKYKGQSLIVTDGTTLLGADDKAGVAEIMTVASKLLRGECEPHGPISIAFTPDEETGRGVDFFDIGRFGADFAYTVDGGQLGELEFENFNAAGGIVKIKGVSIHPGDAKGKMVNASLVASEFMEILPKDERPDTTEGYEGFYHLDSVEGCVEEATLKYIIRDHNRAKFNARKALFASRADSLNEKYGKGTVEVIVKDQYFNMREIIEPDYMFLIDKASDAMRACGVEPIIKPIRGGTDGARLSFLGLPCPNICTGGMNYHGRFECCCVESMQTTVEILSALISGV